MLKFLVSLVAFLLLSGELTAQSSGLLNSDDGKSAGISDGNTNFVATKTWDGGANNSNWNDADNWNPDGIPQPDDNIILDNSTITTDYLVNLPEVSTSTVITSLIINPTSGNVITLNLPSGNTGVPGLDLTGSGDALIINNGGIFKNSSGASSGSVLVLSGIGSSVRINNEGRYIHNTDRAHADIVAKLSTSAGTEKGIFEFDIPGGVGSSDAISASGRTYGTLILSSVAAGGSKNYFCNGNSSLTVKGDFIINSGAKLSYSISADFIIEGDLTMNGNISLTDNGIVILGTTSERTLTHNIGTIIGTFARYIETGSNILFPIGTTSYYRPVEINFTTPPTTSGTLTVGHTDGTDSDVLSPELDDDGYTLNRRSNMFWSITHSTISGGTFEISIDANGLAGIFDPGKLRIILSTDGETSFNLVGSHQNGSVTTAKRISIPGGNYGQFYIASNSSDNPLPAELSFLTANIVGSIVVLQWRTETEVNNYGFEIERADANQQFQKIGFVQGNGNSNSEKEYEFIDEIVTSGKFFYRLKQIDTDGKFEYSHTIEIDFDKPLNYELAQNYPNPFNPVTTIKYQIPEVGIVTLKIYDILGNEISTLVEENQAEGVYEILFDATELSSGIYFYHLKTKSFSAVKKLILLR